VAAVTLDEVLYALLFLRSFRTAFVCGERAPFGIAPDDEESLAALDFDELERAARLACRALLTRSQRGVGTLLDAFPHTIEAWRAAHPPGDLDELAAAFADSAPFAEWQPAGAGNLLAPPLEDVFRRFCEHALGPGLVATARLECAFALLRSLVVNPDPAFALPPFIHRAHQGFYSVIDRDEGPFLVALLDRRLVAGAITPALGAILRGDDRPLEERPFLIAPSKR